MSLRCWLGFHKKEVVVGTANINHVHYDGTSHMDYDVPIVTCQCARCGKRFSWATLPSPGEYVEGN